MTHPLGRLDPAGLDELADRLHGRALIDALEARAGGVLPADVFDYYRFAAREGSTLADNRAAWDAWRIVPRFLRDVSAVSTATTILGRPLGVPFGVAPMALQRLAHPDGEIATARAAARVGALFVLSTSSQTSVEEIGAIAGLTFWFQLYSLASQEDTDGLVDRAVHAGAAAVCITVDGPVPVAPRRGDFHVPPDVVFAHHGRDVESEQHLDWARIERHVARVPVPIVLKGILHPDDARRAADVGVRAVVVSNHGGRALDGAIATADALPDVAEAVQGQLEVLVDGGVRRGSDVLRALALGARVALIGRPLLWGLASGGEPGARIVLEMLARELREDAAFAGVADLAAVPRDLLRTRWR